MNPEVVTAAPPPPAPWEGGPVHVLHVAPHPTDVERTRHHLLGHDARFAVEGTSSGAECLARLSREAFDVLLLADRAADMTGPELLRAVRARRPRLPVILLLRERDEQAAAEAMRLGVFDWLVERAGDLAKLPLVLGNAAARQRVALERAAFAGQARLLVAVRSGLAVDDLLARLVDTARDLLQVEWSLVLLLENADTLVPRAWSAGTPCDLAGMRFPARTAEWERLWSSPVPFRLEPIALSGPWSVAPVLAEIAPTLAVPLVAHGRALGALLVAAPPARHFGPADEAVLRMLADLAAVAVEHHALTDELVHAQRLSTVGRMVAGVAHELNNPLAVIMGTLDLLRHEPLADHFAERLGRLSAQAERAVKIVRTLLAFARKRPAQRTA
ncbi:MAG TPA: histidine kinase dimerization/phospho-acceptor domain-containing protein, partial [Thermoanaerobaculia bacterium]|nr:histidine kinase dimerization/phospho-acceptor domain-containing protein [Thermoanaerobaculia bacterium]